MIPSVAKLPPAPGTAGTPQKVANAGPAVSRLLARIRSTGAAPATNRVEAALAELAKRKGSITLLRNPHAIAHAENLSAVLHAQGRGSVTTPIDLAGVVQRKLGYGHGRISPLSARSGI